jgi:SAM-dependent methyltransferase
MRPSAGPACPVCATPMRGPAGGFRYDCPACGHASATLPVAIVQGAFTLREGDRAAALEPLRRRNFETLLDRLARLQPPGTLLEVGCAHGWFLDAAAARGYRVHGLEPDAPIAAQALRRGHAVTTGFFPAALPADARYDAIVFNDVLEHLPDPAGALRAVHDRLVPGGLAAINLPSSRGALYRIACALHALGWRAPHDRLWQAGFPSPHLSYFRPEGLARMAHAAGLGEVDRVALPSVVHDGLWERLRYDARAGLAARSLSWLALTLALPLLRALPSDIVLAIFRRDDAPDQRRADTAGARVSAAGATTATR